MAFLGRLNPIGILLAGLLMALTYIGGELAQFMLGLPSAAIQAFQGMLLFFLLAVDMLSNYRIRLDLREGRVMDMFGGINPAVLIASLMVAAVPIMLAAIGELVVEKAGVLNLGVEGMMIIGAVCGFAAAVETRKPDPGLRAAAAAGAALSLIFAFLTQMLLANQVATGLALTLFGLGLSSLIGQGYVGDQAARDGAAGLRAADRHAGARHDPVPPRSDGLSVDR